ncbi:hypothetical protein E2R51_10950 [Jeotgalibacillus sp. S-D1]|uniref:DUF5412 family protein n=1 Tax=Jeotgalibacillus sp. S-D1 TaxID=2552189 RepID=UPI001059F69D|nr:DUF5412 family protein [Jeotgalibacillus sp. S-D1]TDL31739.1 hypothetical protein E2R51_10950 [Jeotgalibacillus sp. S-D1]
METKYNLLSFYLTLFCIGLTFYSFYSYVEGSWLISPPNYILLGFSVIAFILGIKGLKDKRNRWTKVRSWLTLVLSSLLSIVLSLAILFGLHFSSGANVYLKTINSPDGKYTIDFYRWDQGAMGTFGVRGELNGPLWIKKRIYIQKRTEDVNVEWESNDAVLINNHLLNLDNGETYGY